MIHFPIPRMIVASIVILFTSHCSAQWTPAYLNVAAGQPLDLVCTGDSTFLLFTDAEELLRTTDLGATWTRHEIGVSLEDVELSPSGWGVGIADTLQGLTRDSCIWQTWDGGRSWRQSSNLGDIPVIAHIIDDLMAIVVGRESIYRTLDGGTSWHTISVPRDSFQDALMMDRDRLILVGVCHVYRTTNGGTSWMESLPLLDSLNTARCEMFHFSYDGVWNLPSRIVSISKASALLLLPGPLYRTLYPWVSDSTAFLFRTSDGGESWEMVYQPERRDRPENWGRILFADSLHGMIAPAFENPWTADYPRNEMIVTSDGGRTWIKIRNPQGGPSPTAMRGAIAWNRRREGIYAFDETVWTEGMRVQLTRFRDPGGSGMPMVEYGSHALRDIAFAGNNEMNIHPLGLMSATSNDRPPSNGKVLISTVEDEGWNTFSRPDVFFVANMRQCRVTMSPSGKMLLTDRDTSQYLFSEDLGRTWVGRRWKDAQLTQPILDNIFMDDSTVILIDGHCNLWRWSLGMDAIEKVLEINRLYRPIADLYTNGAGLWRQDPTSATAYVYGQGFINGYRERILHFLGTTDGGRSWVIHDTTHPIPEAYEQWITMKNPHSWVIVKDGARYFRVEEEISMTTDRGAHWKQVPLPPLRREVRNWESLVSAFTVSSLIADVVDDSVLYVVADRNFYVSSNFGQTWERRSSFPYRWATKIGFTDRENGWVLTNHALLTTTNGGVTWAEPVPPVASVSSFSLPVTYPNPASSSSPAQVAFTLERDMPVGVFVYDLLGRRQRVLHEGRLPAGPQRFTLSTAGLPPGLYFVTVSTPEGVRVGKVVVGR